MRRLPLTATLDQYQAQAQDVLRGHTAGDAEALRFIHTHHPRFLHPEVKWLPLRVSPEDIRAAPFGIDDARLALARGYSFRDWDALQDLVAAIASRTPGVYEFEVAAEAVIDGDRPVLADLLQKAPGLVHARSARVTCHDPAVHGATLLHYVAANGVESYRQRTPPNAGEIAKMLLDAGSDPNALAGMYGGECTVLPMLASSSPPFEAGLQIPLLEILLDGGADPDGRGTGDWVSPVLSALAFGFKDAALALVRRGARADRLPIAAGLGWSTEVQRLLPASPPEERHRALALAAQSGYAAIVEILLDAGEDPNRFNPPGLHAHGTPLHHAASGGHLDVVRLLVGRGAVLGTLDKLWNSTPRGWAEHENKREVAEFLRSREAR